MGRHSFHVIQEKRRRTHRRYQFHCRNERARSCSCLFRHQTYSEYLHRGSRPIGAYQPPAHCVYRYPSRICSHPATERRQISSADERFRSRRPHHQCTQQKETHRHHRPALSSAGVLLEAYSQMVMGQVARQELKSEKPITGNHFHFTL